MSSFLYRLGRGAARRRWRTLGIWVAVLVAIFAVGGALGGKLQDIVRTRVYVRRLEDWEVVARVHGERFGSGHLGSR